MAISLTDVNNDGSDLADKSVTLSAAGTDSCIVIVFSCRRGGISDLTSVTLDGTAMTIHTSNIGADGGVAVSSAVAYLLDADHPGAGTFTLDTTWEFGTEDDFVYAVYEFAGVDQTTPLGTVATNTAINEAQNNTITVTLNSESGEYAISYCVSADGSNTSATHSAPGSLTTVANESVNHARVALACGRDTSVASASEGYAWTIDDGNAETDSILAAAFAVYAAAGGGGLSIPVAQHHRQRL